MGALFGVHSLSLSLSLFLPVCEEKRTSLEGFAGEVSGFHPHFSLTLYHKPLHGTCQSANAAQRSIVSLLALCSLTVSPGVAPPSPQWRIFLLVHTLFAKGSSFTVFPIPKCPCRARLLAAEVSAITPEDYCDLQLIWSSEAA